MIAHDNVGHAALLNRLAAAAASQRRELGARPRVVRDGATLLRVRCPGCDTRVAAVWQTPLGRLVVPFGRTLLYVLPARDAAAPDLPTLVAEHPEAVPDLAAAVFAYLREHVTGGAMPTEGEYSTFLRRLAEHITGQPVLARCRCTGPALHQLDVRKVLRAVRSGRRGVGVSACRHEMNR